MGWFDEQVRIRKENDQRILEEAFMNTANAVLGRHLSFEEGRADEEINEILKYYHAKSTPIPEDIRDFHEQLEYCCRPNGIMYRVVSLQDHWYRDAYGALLAKRKDTQEPEALLPGPLFGYRFYDNKKGRYVNVNSRNSSLFESEAYCFYKPLPTRRLTIADLLRYAFSTWNRSDLILILAVMCIVTLVGLVSTRLNFFLFSQVIPRGDLSLLGGTVLFMLCLSLSTTFLEVIRTLVISKITTKMTLSVESATMMRIITLPSSFFRKYPAGTVSEIAGYVNSLCSTICNSILSVGITSLFSLAYLSQIFRYAPALVIPSMIVLAVTIGFSLISTFAQMGINRKKMELSAANNGLSFSMISGIQKIKLAGAEKRMFARWAKSYARQTALQYSPPFFLKINATLTLAITLAGQFVMYYFAIASHVGFSEYYAFTSAYGSISGAFTGLSSIALAIASIMPSLQMSRPILEAEPEVSEGKRLVTRINGTIEFSHVSFRYDESMPNVVDNLSCKINKGQYVAIVGKTGCGKSTLIRLLLGFEKPQKGAIYVDGKDISKLDLKSLRSRIGVVMQDGSLFPGDIYSNIVISAPHLTETDAWEAAEIADLADDIRKMPMGMHTIISEGSGGISGGQKQRLMIARAVAKKPKILIFDEATSALDNITQKKVSEALDRLKCTRIVIAHRLSTIRNCQRILYVDGGQILEEGTYEELMEKQGAFYELVNRQKI